MGELFERYHSVLGLFPLIRRPPFSIYDATNDKVSDFCVRAMPSVDCVDESHFFIYIATNTHLC